MNTTRRGFLASSVAATGAAVAPLAHAADDGHHQALPSDPALRVKSLESLLVEKGMVDPSMHMSIRLVPATARGSSRGRGAMRTTSNAS
jgi:hypothetical protein